MSLQFRLGTMNCWCVCVCVWCSLGHWAMTTAAGKTSSRATNNAIGYHAPPVIYNQTQGPVYIRHLSEYGIIWCNTSAVADIKWTYNGGPLPDYFRVNTTSTGSRLIAHNGNEIIRGYVQCVVSNAHGCTVGDNILVAHAVLERRGTLDINISGVAVGDHVTLSCDESFYHDPPARVTWYRKALSFRDKEKMRPHDRFFCSPDETICVLSSIIPTDDDNYSCELEQHGIVRKKIFRLQIKNDPDVDHTQTVQLLNLINHVSSKRKIYMRPGEDATLQCVFRGSPHHVNWTYQHYYNSGCSADDIAINHGDKNGRLAIRKRGPILEIANFSAQDEGYYSCLAHTSEDYYSHQIELKLVRPPLLQVPIVEERIVEGSDIHLNCSSPGTVPVPKVRWMINATHWNKSHPRFAHFHLDDDNNTLVIRNAEPGDSCTVMCNVSNNFGHALGYRSILVSPKQGNTSKGLSTPSNWQVTNIPTTGVPSSTEHETRCARVNVQTGNKTTDLYDFLRDGRCTIDIQTLGEIFKTLDTNEMGQLFPERPRVFAENTAANGSQRVINYPQREKVLQSPSGRHMIFLPITLEQNSTQRRSVNFDCEAPYGCRVTVSSPLRQENVNPGKSKTCKSKLFHDANDIAISIEKKDSYDSHGKLKKVRLRISTNWKQPNAAQCRTRDDTVVEISLSRYVKTLPSGFHIDWDVFYYNPYTVVSHRQSEECQTKKTVVEIDVYGGRRPDNATCWTENHGRKIQVDLGQGSHIELCRLTRLQRNKK